MSSQPNNPLPNPHPPSEPNSRPRPILKAAAAAGENPQVAGAAPPRKNRHYRVLGNKRQLTQAVIPIDRIEKMQLQPKKPTRVLSTQNSAASLATSRHYQSSYRSKHLINSGTKRPPISIPRSTKNRTRNSGEMAHNSANMVCHTSRALKAVAAYKSEFAEFTPGSTLTILNDPASAGSSSGKTPRRLVNSKASVPHIRIYRETKSQTVDARLAPKFVVDPASILLIGNSSSVKKLQQPPPASEAVTVGKRKSSLDGDNVLFQKVVLIQPIAPKNITYVPQFFC